jgi:hypothetical protein
MTSAIELHQWITAIGFSYVEEPEPMEGNTQRFMVNPQDARFIRDFFDLCKYHERIQ